MTYRHISFSESIVMKELEKISRKNGLIVEDLYIPILNKKASANDQLVSNDDVFEDSIKLSAALREKGYHKQANALEEKVFMFKQAYNNAEQDIEARQEREKNYYDTNIGGDAVDAAHKAVEQDRIQSKETDGIVHDINQTQQMILNTLKHEPKKANENAKNLIAMALNAIVKKADDPKKDNSAALIAAKATIESNLNSIITKVNPTFEIARVAANKADIETTIGIVEGSKIPQVDETIAKAKTAIGVYSAAVSALQKVKAMTATEGDINTVYKYLDLFPAGQKSSLRDSFNALTKTQRDFNAYNDKDSTEAHTARKKIEAARDAHKINVDNLIALFSGKDLDLPTYVAAAINVPARQALLAQLNAEQAKLKPLYEQLVAIKFDGTAPTTSEQPAISSSVPATTTPPVAATTSEQPKQSVAPAPEPNQSTVNGPTVAAYKYQDIIQKIADIVSTNQASFYGTILDKTTINPPITYFTDLVPFITEFNKNKESFKTLLVNNTGYDPLKILNVGEIKAQIGRFDSLLNEYQTKILPKVENKKYKPQVLQVINEMTSGDLGRRRSKFQVLLNSDKMPEGSNAAEMKNRMDIVINDFKTTIDGGIASLKQLKDLLATDAEVESKQQAFDATKDFMAAAPNKKTSSNMYDGLIKKANPLVVQWGGGSAATTPGAKPAGGGGGQQAKPKYNDATQAAVRDMQKLCLYFGDFILKKKTEVSPDEAKKLGQLYTNLFTSQKGFAGADIDGNWGTQTTKALNDVNKIMSQFGNAGGGQVEVNAKNQSETEEDVRNRADKNTRIMVSALSALDADLASRVGGKYQNVIIVDQLPMTIQSTLTEVKNGIPLSLRNLNSMLVLKAYLLRNGFVLTSNGGGGVDTNTASTNTKNNPAVMVDNEASQEASQKQLNANSIISMINKFADKIPMNDWISQDARRSTVIGSMVNDITKNLRVQGKSENEIADIVGQMYAEMRKYTIDNSLPIADQVKAFSDQMRSISSFVYNGIADHYKNNTNTSGVPSSKNDTSWTRAQWVALLKYLLQRAQAQKEEAESKANELLDAGNSKEKAAQNLAQMKGQYLASVQNLVSELKNVCMNNAKQITTDNDKVFDSWISQSGSGPDGNGSGGAGGGSNGRNRGGANGSGGQGFSGGDGNTASMEAIKRDPFNVRGSNKDLLYIRDLLTAFNIPSAICPNVAKGPFTLHKSNLESGTFAALQQDLSNAQGLGDQSYLYELSEALDQIWNKFTQGKSSDVIAPQEEAYRRLGAGITAMKRNVPDVRGKQQQQANAQQQGQMDYVRDAASWYQTVTSGEMTKWLESKGYVYNQKNTNEYNWVKQLGNGKTITIYSDGSVWLKDPSLPPGQDSKKMGLFYEMNAQAAVNSK